MLRSLPVTALALVFLSTACAAPRSSGSATTTPAAAGAEPRSGPVSGATPTAAQAGHAKSSLVCRYECPTGSNIPQRVCYTQDALDESAAAAQDALRRAIQQGTMEPIKD